MPPSSRLVVCLLFSSLLFVLPAAAQNPIVETATYVPATEDIWRVGGEDSVTYGVRFSLGAETQITRVGVANFTGTGSFYAAIVPIFGGTGFPAGLPFNVGDVIAQTVFTAQGGDQRIPLAATLPSGNYMLVVGSGQFGASGEGFIATAGQTLLHNSAIFFTNIDFGWSAARAYTSGVSDPLRFVIAADDPHQLILESVETRSSQASVDALASSVSTRATQASVDFIASNLTAGLNNVFAAINTRATQASVNAVMTSINGMASALNALPPAFNALPQLSHFQALSANLTGAVSGLATQASVDALATQLGDAASTDLFIEQSLAMGLRVARLWLPGVVGGDLEHVREIVNARLTAAEQIGIIPKNARKSFGNGDAALAAGDYRAAYDWYSDAYRQLNK